MAPPVEISGAAAEASEAAEEGAVVEEAAVAVEEAAAAAAAAEEIAATAAEKGGDAVAERVDRPISTVLIVIAMQTEALPLVNKFQLAEDTGQSLFPKGVPWVRYHGKYKDLYINLVWPGKDSVLGVDSVGTVSASLVTYASIQAFNPDLIINAGTAGGFKAKGASVGDVYIASDVAFHDRRIPIPVFDMYGIGARRTFSAPNLLKELNLKLGKLSTGDSLDMSPQDEAAILANDATIKDMEVWDVLSNKEVIDIVASAPSRSLAARSLVESAVRAWRIKYPMSKPDDCAAVCLFLNAHSSGDSSNLKKNDIVVSFDATEVDNGRSKQLSTYQPHRQLTDVAAVEGEEWSALEGVSRVNTLLTLPRFVAAGKQSTSSKN